MKLNQILNEDDGFDKWRKEMGADKVDDFLAAFGFGPKYVPPVIEKIECPKCKKKEAVWREQHPDTDMNEMALECDGCGHMHYND